MMLCRDIDGFATSWVHLIVQVFVEYLQAWDLAKPIQLCPVEDDRFVWVDLHYLLFTRWPQHIGSSFTVTSGGKSSLDDEGSNKVQNVLFASTAWEVLDDKHEALSEHGGQQYLCLV